MIFVPFGAKIYSTFNLAVYKAMYVADHTQTSFLFVLFLKMDSIVSEFFFKSKQAIQI